MSDAPLSREQANSLIRRAQSGDRQAMDVLVERNVALVKSIVKRFLGRGLEYDDLFQLGCVGLIKAVNNFSGEYGVMFSTYAVPMIAGEIRRFLRDDGAIKVSRTLKELAYKAQRESSRICAETGREPSVGVLAELVGCDCAELVAAMDACRGCMSLSEPVFEDDTGELIDRISVSEEPGTDIERILLKELIGSLPPRDRKLITLRYFCDKTQSETAKLLGVSQVQVSRLEGRIIAALRGMMSG